MQLFIPIGPKDESSESKWECSHPESRQLNMFPPHDSKFAFRPPALHRSHHRTAVVSAVFNFPEEEEKVLKFWREIDAFQTSLKLSEGRPVYSFYDGPPFATGLPHYGHLLAGTIKVIDPFYLHVIRSSETLDLIAGYRHTTRPRLGLLRTTTLRLGHPRRPRRARD